MISLKPGRLRVPALALFVSLFSPTDSTRYYDITGTSAAELRREMNRLRPTSPDGQRHDARTDWHIHWQFRTSRTPSGCAVTSSDVSLDVVMILPRWTNDAEASSALLQRWRKYYAALLLHEDGHRKLATQSAQAIRDAIGGMQGPGRCADLDPTVSQKANGILEQYRQKERQYDAETGHGRTQGATF